MTKRRLQEKPFFPSNDNSRLIYFILGCFILGTGMLVAIQYNLSASTDQLLQGNTRLLQELSMSNDLRETEHIMFEMESKIRTTIATQHPVHLAGIGEQASRAVHLLQGLQAHEQDAGIRDRLKRLGQLIQERMAAIEHLQEPNGVTAADTMIIANPMARYRSNEISELIRTIYQVRQQRIQRLTEDAAQFGRKARIMAAMLVVLLLVFAAWLGWFVIGRIRQQKRMIALLQASKSKTQAAVMVKDNFMANMSHEIRTPLNAILGFTNLLVKKGLDTQSREFVDAIQHSGEALLAIVNDILDLSKIEAGMMRIVPTTFSLRGLVQSVETLFSEKIRRKGLEFLHHIDDELPDTLVGDPTRLTQILVNLLDNAIKFTDKGSISLVISVASRQAGNVTLSFVIRDTGIGIASDKLPEVFERFRQAEDSITRRYGGTGLGLSIVRELLRLQNGDIHVDSLPGQRTTFTFKLPYNIADEQRCRPSGAREPAALLPPSLRLLVVDDNEMNQSLMKHLLSQWDISFDIVSGAPAALEYLRYQNYDLVLMDIQMPGMDGYSATDIIRRKMNLQVPVIAMTAHAFLGEREKCLSNGMNDYLSKPIRERELLGVISRFGGQSRPAVGHQPANAPVKPAYAYLNLAYMQEISRGNTAYERTVTRQFIEYIPGCVTGIHQAITNRDLDKLHFYAHDMKNAVQIMGLDPRVEKTLDSLENTPAITLAALADVRWVTNYIQYALIDAEALLASLPVI